MADFRITKRPQRLRQTAAMRKLVADTSVSPSKLIQPIFVHWGSQLRNEITSMPGQYQWSVDRVAEFADEIQAADVGAVILFGIPKAKDAVGSDSAHENGIVQTAIREIKRHFPDLLVIADTCLCEYTSHGHCGLMNDDGELRGDETLEILQQIAVSQAAAGADVVAPSGMIDGMVGAIRESLDAAGFQQTPIMSYAVKYASAFYGPFRDAADGAPAFGDRRSHQMDPAFAKAALIEAEQDVEQGADFLMVKPAMAYLDVLRQLSDAFPTTPRVAYNVSGEYTMVKAAAANGWLDEAAVVDELLTSMMRAGADLVITYHALDFAKTLTDRVKET